MPFVIPSIRDAVLIVSPIAVYSSRCSEPTLPDMNGPLFSPMPILKPCSKPSSRSRSLNFGSRVSSISRAAASARSAWSACSSGAPKTAIIPSPV